MPVGLLNRPAARRPGALRQMTAAVLFMAAIPLAFSLGGAAAGSPLLFNSVWRAAVAFVCLLYLLPGGKPRKNRRRNRRASLLRQALRRTPHRYLLLASVGNLEYLLFVYSLRFIDVSLTTVIYESWPLMLILVTAHLYRSDRRYRQPSLRKLLPALLLTMSGCLLAAYSQHGGIGGSADGIMKTAAGSGLALGSALLAPLLAFGFQWASGVSRERHEPGEPPDQEDEIRLAVWAFMLSSLTVAAITGAAGLVAREQLGWHGAAIALAGGGLLNAAGGIAWRRAHFLAQDVRIHAMAYFIPAAAICFLLLAGQGAVAQPWLLAGGVAAVIAGNLFLNLKKES